MESPTEPRASCLSFQIDLRRMLVETTCFSRACAVRWLPKAPFLIEALSEQVVIPYINEPSSLGFGGSHFVAIVFEAGYGVVDNPMVPIVAGLLKVSFAITAAPLRQKMSCGDHRGRMAYSTLAWFKNTPATCTKRRHDQACTPPFSRLFRRPCTRSFFGSEFSDLAFANVLRISEH